MRHIPLQHKFVCLVYISHNHIHLGKMTSAIIQADDISSQPTFKKKILNLKIESTVIHVSVRARASIKVL